MRKRFVVSVVAVAVVAAACSSDGAVASSTTTSSNEVTSTNLAPTTTNTTVTSTTAAAPTTTTASSTTTTAPATTTTMDGNWADEPLVTAGFGALGWWDGDEWLDAQSEGSLPVAGGEDYQVSLLGDLATTTGGAETVVCEPLELVGVHLDDSELLGAWPGPVGLAISAPWQLQPNLFEEITDDGTYAEFAAELLADRGLEVADPVIKQVIRTDLEGDGVHEVLVVAEEVTTSLLMEEGDYSISFLRKVVQGEVQTAILGDTVVAGEEDRFAGAHGIGGVADMNGDGKMEIIANSAFFEGFTATVWEYVNDDLGPVVALQTGCGV